MKSRTVFLSLILCLTFTSVTAIITLNDITNLRESSTFGHRSPQRGLLLLHWFASNITIDQNDVIRLHFDPTRGDYGFHHYDNSLTDLNTQRSAFPEVPNKRDTAYYSLGNLSPPSVRSQFPAYVTQDNNNSQSHENNPDRVVIRIQRHNPSIVEAVYITQHYVNRSRGSGYDPDATFQISTRLLQQIQALSTNTGYGKYSNLGNDASAAGFQQRVAYIQSLYPNVPGLANFLAHAGFEYNRKTLLFAKVFSRSVPNIHGGRNRRSTDITCNLSDDLKLEVKSTSNGYARIVWRGIPSHLINKATDIGVAQENDYYLLETFSFDSSRCGSIDTSVSLNHGLQVRLLQITSYVNYIFYQSSTYDILQAGPIFDEANNVKPTKLSSYEASLQLYVKDGYACARLYIKKSFHDWKIVFQNAWVGFYRSGWDISQDYVRYEWATNFEKRSDSGDYNIYVYESSLAMSPGVQLRFIDKEYTFRVSLEPWEGVYKILEPPQKTSFAAMFGAK